MGWTSIAWQRGSKLREVMRRELECSWTTPDGTPVRVECISDTIRNRRDYYGLYQNGTDYWIVCAMTQLRKDYDAWLASDWSLTYKEMECTAHPYMYDVPRPMFLQYETLKPVPSNQYEAEWRSEVRKVLGMPPHPYVSKQNAA